MRYGGWFAPVRLFRLPAATFVYKQTACRVQCVRRRLGVPRKSTEIRIGWPLRALRLEIRGANAEAKNRGLRFAPVVEMEFGERKALKVVSNSAEAARRLISPGVRWQIDQLARMKPEHELWVTIDRGWLTITRSGYLRQPEPLDDFVRYSLELFDQFLLTMSDDIDFHDDVIATVEQTQCPVCSSDIEGEMVLCVRCKTPHCHDCWMYNGKCGMYACNETRFARVG